MGLFKIYIKGSKHIETILFVDNNIHRYVGYLHIHIINIIVRYTLSLTLLK